MERWVDPRIALLEKYPGYDISELDHLIEDEGLQAEYTPELMRVLFETLSGFAIFGIDLGYLYDIGSDYTGFEFIWLKKFLKFDDKCTAIGSTGIDETLAELIEEQCNRGEKLVVGESAYKEVIEDQLVSDTLQRWRTEPFIMITGSGRWVPPTLPSTRSPEREKESTFAAGRSRRVEVERTLTDTLRDEFEDMLRALTLERSQIKAAMGFALDNADAAAEIVEVLAESLTLKETPIPTKVWSTTGGQKIAEWTDPVAAQDDSYSCITCSSVQKKQKKDGNLIFVAIGTANGEDFADEKFMGISGKTAKLFSVKDKKEVLKIPSEDVRALSLSQMCHVMKEALSLIRAIVIAGPYPADVCV
ncbi:hypothetical protein ACQ4PT_050755 [Festuca glaucescens]